MLRLFQFVLNALWAVIPKLAADLRIAVEQTHGPESARELAALPPVLVRYRSWIGGDRDGNPKVTSDVTRQTLQTVAETAIELHAQALIDLRRDLSISTTWAETPEELLAAIDANEATFGPDLVDGAEVLKPTEPVRLFIDQVHAKLLRQVDAACDGPVYGTPELLADLRLLRDSLIKMGMPRLANEGGLADLMLRVRTFGLRLVTLDIRQHSGRHEAAITELLRLGGVHDDYASLSEAERLSLLKNELSQPRPLKPLGMPVSEDTEEILATLRVVQEGRMRDPLAVRSYVVSMTHDVSDLLEVLILMREIGLYRVLPAEGGGYRIESDLDVVPLFETIDDLQRAPGLLEEMFTDPVYKAHMIARHHAADRVAERASGCTDTAETEPGLFQEIMLGYSDSNKDGGFLMANVSLDIAQAAIAEVCAKHGVKKRLFHGRGGSIGRGGGRANKAILASPPGSHRGQIRVTEQGEVISFRYALPAIARRHLEQIVNAMLLVTARQEKSIDVEESTKKLVADLADSAMSSYRTLVDDPEFWPWFLSVTPVAHIGGLPIASRPISRGLSGGAGGGVPSMTFDKIRAIPWVFSWTQTRYNVPGWFGIGAAFAALDDAQMDQLAKAYQVWPFFHAVIDNAQQEMARCRLPIATRYGQAVADQVSGTEKIHKIIVEDFGKAKAAILRITGQAELLDNVPVIQRSIQVRNPWTDLLNLAQIELLNRHRAAESDEQREALRPLIFASINSIAAAMQSTG